VTRKRSAIFKDRFQVAKQTRLKSLILEICNGKNYQRMRPQAMKRIPPQVVIRQKI